jgi:UDP-N-acetylmuramoylalanine--D-glutamate ligase
MFLIFGKGKSGKAAAKLLESKGLKYVLVDDNTHYWEKYLEKVSTVVVSPGIKPNHKVFKLSQKLNKELIGETELAYRFWKGKIVAITGTDGKTTTTTLVYKILSSYLPSVYIGGNIGTPFSEIVSKTEQGIAILEISSFQGYTLKRFRPNSGAFLNFAEDHLDWHKDINDYLSGKYRIFQNQREEDLIFLNGENESVLRTPSKARKVVFGNHPESAFKISDGWFYYRDIPLFEHTKLKLKGKHNLWNTAVAAAVGYEWGVPLKVIREVAYSFGGLPYRLQYIGNFGGIEIYNDSKSTTPNALRAALESFNRKVVLIFGGYDKGADFKPLRRLFKEKVRFAIAYGGNREKLKEQLGEIVPFKTVPNLEEAVNFAKEILKEEDILLFSPASASFDQFCSYEERGEVFNKLVKEFFSK